MVRFSEPSGNLIARADCTMNKNVFGSMCGLAIMVLTLSPLVAAQNQDSTTAQQKSSPITKGIDYLFNYLNMAGTMKAVDFRPLTQQERTHLYLKTMINPLGYFKAGLSTGIDQWKDKPSEWEQGASGYGKRFANILGQYSIQRTVTFGVSSVLHEDNRYFNSGKKGLWQRAGYALVSGILARHDDGSRHLSVSQLGGWQPVLSYPGSGSLRASTPREMEL